MLSRTNVVLIGMPGCGKSTLGRRLAKIRGMSFVDTDTLIERAEKKSLQDIVNRRGVRYLRQLESHVLSNMTVENTVIATGGSAVYSHAAMRHLGANGVVVYLQISLTTLVQRASNKSETVRMVLTPEPSQDMKPMVHSSRSEGMLAGL